MSANGDWAENSTLADLLAARRRARLVSGLRGRVRLDAPDRIAAAAGASAQAAGAAVDTEAEAETECDLCGIAIAERHRHLLHLVERQIICACESCWNVHSGDAEYRPAGNRTVWLPDLEVPDEIWASFQIPIGLAFFMDSTVTACVVALYPSPGGATESELHFESWRRLVDLNPVLAELEPDIEGLVVNRLSNPPAYAIAPIDQCYALTGLIKMHWQGISGGPGVHEAVEGFFEGLRSEGVAS
jgi:Family of unknown function (DUF5947)